MTANKIYYPGHTGGKILGTQLSIQNTTDEAITCSSTNGVYYSYDGRDYQLLSLGGITVPAGGVVNVNKEYPVDLKPTSDTKIMVDSAGLSGCILDCLVTWEV